MKTQIFIDHDVLSCDSVCNCLYSGAFGGMSDLVLIAGDAMEAVEVPFACPLPVDIFMHHW